METGQQSKHKGLKLFFFGVVLSVIAMLAITGGYAYAESPVFCGSCHSMKTVYSTWAHSNHKQFACTECHLPNGNLAVKLAAKAQTGIVDVYHETLRDYPDKLEVTVSGKRYLNDNCLRCHGSTVENTNLCARGTDCTRCHRDLVHGRGSTIKGGIKLE